MPRGGKRVGAGRPPGIHTKHKSTLRKEEAREALRQIVLENMREMTDAQIKHAKGISYLVYRSKKGGKFTKVEPDTDLRALQESDDVLIEVWSKDPSIQAYTDLMNRAIDKPAETVHTTVEGSLSVELVDRLKAGRDRLAKVKHGNG